MRILSGTPLHWELHDGVQVNATQLSGRSQLVGLLGVLLRGSQGFIDCAGAWSWCTPTCTPMTLGAKEVYVSDGSDEVECDNSDSFSGHHPTHDN